MSEPVGVLDTKRNLLRPLLLVLIYSPLTNSWKDLCGNYHWRICYNLYKVYNFRFQFLKSNFHECNYHVMKVWETSLYYARILKIYITCQYQINKWTIFWIFKTGWIFNHVQDGHYQGCSGMAPYLKSVTQISQW